MLGTRQERSLVIVIIKKNVGLHCATQYKYNTTSPQPLLMHLFIFAAVVCTLKLNDLPCSHCVQVYSAKTVAVHFVSDAICRMSREAFIGKNCDISDVELVAGYVFQECSPSICATPR